MNHEKYQKLSAQELAEKLKDGACRQADLTCELIGYCRFLEPTLRDHGANHVAGKLTDILGRFDALDAEMKEVIAVNAKSLQGRLSHILKTFDRVAAEAHAETENTDGSEGVTQ